MSESAHYVIGKIACIVAMHRFLCQQRTYRSMSEPIAPGAGDDSLHSLEKSGHSVLAAEAAKADAADWIERQFHPGL